MRQGKTASAHTARGRGGETGAPGVTRRRVLFGLAGAAGLLAGAGCGTYGGEPHAGYRAAVPPDRSWRLWYPAPPWELRRNDTTETVVAVYPPYGVPENGLAFPMLMELTVRRTAAASPDAAVAAWLAALRARGGRVLYAPRASWVGAPGLALAPLDAGPMPLDAGSLARRSVEAAGADVHFTERYVATTLDDRTVVALAVRSVLDVSEDRGVTAMLRLFEPRPVPVGP